MFIQSSGLVTAVLLVASLPTVSQGADKVWTRNTAKSTKDSGQGTPAFTDMSYWVDEQGNVGSGSPTENDVFIFSGTRLRHKFSGTFAGKSLQIGTDSSAADVCHDSGSPTFANDGLKLLNGNWWVNMQGSPTIGGPVTVLSESRPFVIHYGQEKYIGYTATFSGTFSGGPNAWTLFGPHGSFKSGSTTNPHCASNTTFALSDISAYEGLIAVSSLYANVGTDFGTRLKLGSADSTARLLIGHGGSLATVRGTDVVTLSELSFASDAQLVVTRTGTYGHALGLIRAQNNLSFERSLPVFMNTSIYGNGFLRLPILSWPSSEGYDEEDFELVCGPDCLNWDLTLEVGPDEDHPGYDALYLTGYGLVVQTLDYDKESTRDGVIPSSMTNAAAWSDGELPHGDSAYLSTKTLRTETDSKLDFQFPGTSFWQKGGALCLACRSFNVSDLYVGKVNDSSGTVYLNSVKAAPSTSTYKADHFHFLGTPVHVKSFVSHLVVFDGEIDGPGPLVLEGYDGTGSPQAFYRLTGLNTNYTGRITVKQLETRPEYLDRGSHYQTLYVDDGRNLGGAMPTFDPRALTLARYSKLCVNNSNLVTLEDGLSRGLYVQGHGRIEVVDAKRTCEVRWPMLLSGTFWKEGAGTLVLAGPLRHEATDGGDVTDIPRAGSNLVSVAAGTLAVAHADALAGTKTTFAGNTKLVIRYGATADDLSAFGIRNTAERHPFVLNAALGGNLPLTLDVSALPVPTAADGPTLGLVTVSDAAADEVENMLPETFKVWKGYRSTRVKTHDAESGTTTFSVASTQTGAILIVR